MCEFFSFRSDGNGKVFFLNAEQRAKAIADGQGEYIDSHSFIAEFYGYTGENDDLLNKYEYNPWTKEFTVDTIMNYHTMDDRKQCEEWVRSLNFDEMFPAIMGIKLGSRVRSIKGVGNAKCIGALGTVKSTNMNRHFAVEFDENIDGHDRLSSVFVHDGKMGHCWFCSIEKLEAVIE